jgi:hypothetical protein
MLSNIEKNPKISKFQIKIPNQKVNHILNEKNLSLEINFPHIYFLNFPLFIIFNSYCLFGFKSGPEDVMAFEENNNNSRNICILKCVSKKLHNYMKNRRKKIGKQEFIKSVTFLIRFLSRFFEHNLSISKKFKGLVFLYFNYNSKLEYIFNFLLYKDRLLGLRKKSYNNHFSQSISKTLSFINGYITSKYSNLLLNKILSEKIFNEYEQNRFKFLLSFKIKCLAGRKILTQSRMFFKKRRCSTDITILLQKLVQI